MRLPFPTLAAAALLAAAPAFAQTPAPRPNDGAFNLPAMCDTEVNYRRLVELSSVDVSDMTAVREWQTLAQQSCVIPAFASGFVVVEEKGDMLQVELRATNPSGQVQTGGRYWLAKRHVDRFRCAAVTLNARTTC
jgi:hypothetical protein